MKLNRIERRETNAWKLKWGNWGNGEMENVVEQNRQKNFNSELCSNCANKIVKASTKAQYTSNYQILIRKWKRKMKHFFPR